MGGESQTMASVGYANRMDSFILARIGSHKKEEGQIYYTNSKITR